MADISHQLKTPLTSLEILNATLLQEGLDQEQQSSLLHQQLNLLSGMEWMISVLLKLSCLDAGTIALEHKMVLVKELIQQATAPFAVMLDLKNIVLDISDPSNIQICGDDKWTAEALSNIIKNSMESTPDGGRISIRTEENAMYVKIIITDSGKGISKEDMPHLFERFYRGKHAGKNGIGIGLALSKTIITRQNGTIEVENAMPHGARFTVCFYKGVV